MTLNSWNWNLSTDEERGKLHLGHFECRGGRQIPHLLGYHPPTYPPKELKLVDKFLIQSLQAQSNCHLDVGYHCSILVVFLGAQISIWESKQVLSNNNNRRVKRKLPVIAGSCKCQRIVGHGCNFILIIFWNHCLLASCPPSFSASSGINSAPADLLGGHLRGLDPDLGGQ